MVDKVTKLMQYAIEQCGYDRHYEVSFGADMNTPIVCITEPDGTAIYGVRFEGDEICKYK